MEAFSCLKYHHKLRTPSNKVCSPSAHHWLHERQHWFSLTSAWFNNSPCSLWTNVSCMLLYKLRLHRLRMNSTEFVTLWNSITEWDISVWIVLRGILHARTHNKTCLIVSEKQSHGQRWGSRKCIWNSAFQEPICISWLFQICWENLNVFELWSPLQQVSVVSEHQREPYSKPSTQSFTTASV